MIEEENNHGITNEDLDTLRVLLHTIHGISAVSTTTSYLPQDESEK
jgi:hypothetical protein